jgi:hypothetical protein
VSYTEEPVGFFFPGTEEKQLPRRKIPILLIGATFLTAISASASEFWDSKNWNTWSKDECEKLLTESPWTHSWTGVYSTIIGRIDRPLDAGLNSNDLIYTVQIKSALPMREAIAREDQFSENYKKMPADERKASDAVAATFLNQSPPDVILVRVDLTKGVDIVAADRILSVSLVADDGTQVSATGDQLARTGKFLNVTFPRVINGLPTIKLGQKSFSIEFQSPQVLFDDPGVPVQSQVVKTPAQTVKVKFDLGKMLVGGKPNF